jgi:heme oxygenase
MHISALSELRLATRAIHQDLEKNLIILRPGAGAPEYKLYLAAFWGWLSAFERRLWESSWPEPIMAAQRADKCAWIVSDLRAAGMDAESIGRLPVCPAVPDISSTPARFGLAYVIEGAQLGTQVLRKTLGPSLAPWEPRTLAGYGDATASRWKAFTECADRCLDTAASRQAAASAAHDAFAALADWFRIRQVA